MPLSALAQFLLKTPTYHDVWIKIPDTKSGLKTSQTHVALKTFVLDFIVYPSPSDEKVKAAVCRRCLVTTEKLEASYLWL